MKDLDVYKIEIYIPAEYLEKLQAAITRAGAGKFGMYDYSMAVMQVKGYWRPLAGAHPFKGEIGQIETADEVKVEINCKHEHIPEVLRSIREVHPYEVPVINILPLMNQYFMGEDGEINYGP